MRRRLQYSVALLLVLCVLGVSGIAAAQTVLHESHHAHHQAGTHGTVLCSWMCAAGIAVGTDQLAVSSSTLYCGLAVVQRDVLYQPDLLSSQHPRGPPVRPL